MTAASPDSPLILETPFGDAYRLLDSGNGRKLEQVGPYRFIRPEAQALWAPETGWSDMEISGEFITSADARNDDGGKWRLAPGLPATWPMQYDGIGFLAMPTPFRHLGFFPEQAAHWEWCGEAISAFTQRQNSPPRILNLFGYTGIASLHAARAGAEITHVDASKKAISLAFANRDHAGMKDAPIRFITEDARTFVKREARRGKRYHGILLDPPKYGRGDKGEVWRMEDDIAQLLKDTRAIMEDDALFVVLTAYAIRSSPLSLHHIIEHVFGGMGGGVESGELALRENNKRGYRIGQANFARWHRQNSA